MRRTQRHLADGRAIVYFDRDGRPERTAVDERDLHGQRPAQAQLRRDALTGEWIAIAGHRQDRTFLPSADECPLCASTPGHLTEIPEAQYDVAVFENRFPSFSGAGEGDATDLTELVMAPALGRCEVVAYCQDHDGSLGALDTEAMALVIDAWVDRTRELSVLPGVRSVFVFENRGGEVGVTLHHPHGQIYAYPFVPPALSRVLEQAALAHERGERLLADLVAAEVADGSRVVARDEHWVVFVPFAARWPYEVQVHPLADRGSLADLTTPERASLAVLLPSLARTLDSLFDTPLPTMSGWYQRPAHPTAAEERDARLFLRVISNRRAAQKLKYLASSESLMGAFIGDVVPEDAAAALRTAWASA